MKMLCTMTDQEFDQIARWIDCREWANPMEDEFIFYDPTEQFQLILAMFGIKTYTSGE